MWGDSLRCTGIEKSEGRNKTKHIVVIHIYPEEH